MFNDEKWELWVYIFKNKKKERRGKGEKEEMREGGKKKEGGKIWNKLVFINDRSNRFKLILFFFILFKVKILFKFINNRKRICIFLY